MPRPETTRPRLRPRPELTRPRLTFVTSRPRPSSRPNVM